MPGKNHGPSIKNPDEYDALRKEGKSKSTAAAISNKGRTHKGASAMAKKAAATRKKRGS